MVFADWPRRELLPFPERAGCLPGPQKCSNCSAFSSSSSCREPLGGGGCRSVVAPSRTVSAASRPPESAASGVPSASQGTGALLSEANPCKCLCPVCCCLSPAWGNRFCLRFPPGERRAAALLSPSPGRDAAQAAAALAAGALPALLALGKHGSAAGSRRERELLANRCCAKSGLGGEVLALARQCSCRALGRRAGAAVGREGGGPQLGGNSLTSCLLLCRAPAVSGNP